MAFNQQSGPPASGRQVQELVALIQAAGHTDLRDARGALGLTQRQAGGRFTRDEAEALIARLEGERDGLPAPSTSTVPHAAEHPTGLAGIPSEVLAGELQRRGWVVMEP